MNNLLVALCLVTAASTTVFAFSEEDNNFIAKFNKEMCFRKAAKDDAICIGLVQKLTQPEQLQELAMEAMRIRMLATNSDQNASKLLEAVNSSLGYK